MSGRYGREGLLLAPHFTFHAVSAEISLLALDSRFPLHRTQQAHIGDVGDPHIFGFHAGLACAVLQMKSHRLFRESPGSSALMAGEISLIAVRAVSESTLSSFEATAAACSGFCRINDMARR